MNNSPATKRPTSGMVPTVLGLTLLLLAFTAVIQLGHWLNSPGGTWLDPNPAQAIATWVKTDREWSGWHTTVAVTFGLLLLGGLYLILNAIAKRARKREHIDSAAKYMGRGESMTLKAVTAENASAGYTSHEKVGVMLGHGVRAKQDLYADWRSTILAIMGPGSGKTTCLCVPPALEAPGWVYGTSNKRDFPDAIWKPRADLGTMYCFDPQGIAEVHATWYWDPLTYVTDDTHAIIQANLFADAAKDSDAKTDGFFDPRGRALLAGLLLAAAGAVPVGTTPVKPVAKYPLTQLFQWVSQPGVDNPALILADNGWDMLAFDLKGIYKLPEETKRGIFANAAKILAFLFNRSALPWICKQGPNDDRPQFDPHQFVRSDADTLISLSKEGVGSLGPIVSALTIAVLDAAEDYAKHCPGGRLPVPGVVILDEAANAVRDKELPNRYSHYGSRGICPTTILQSRAQGEAAWGKTGMDKLAGASTHRIYGRGIEDDALLRNLSTLIGNRDELQYSTGSSGSGMFSGGRSSNSVNASYHKVPILEPADIHAMPKWRALMSIAGERPVLVKLIPHMARPGMKEAVAASNALHSPETHVTV